LKTQHEIYLTTDSNIVIAQKAKEKRNYLWTA
jgi:hypothetical protein